MCFCHTGFAAYIARRAWYLNRSGRRAIKSDSALSTVFSKSSTCKGIGRLVTIRSRGRRIRRSTRRGNRTVVSSSAIARNSCQTCCGTVTTRRASQAVFRLSSQRLITVSSDGTGILSRRFRILWAIVACRTSCGGRSPRLTVITSGTGDAFGLLYTRLIGTSSTGCGRR